MCLHACTSTSLNRIVHSFSQIFIPLITLPLIVFTLEHHDAENSNKSRHHHAVEDHPNPVSSSSAILDMPVIQVWTHLSARGITTVLVS